jgi:hypothetical protein
MSKLDHLSKMPVEQFIPQIGKLTTSVWFEQQKLESALWIPIAPIDTGLSWVHQPEKPEFGLDPLFFPQKDWRDLEGQLFQGAGVDDESAVYLGVRHNPVEVESIRFVKRDGLRFLVDCRLFCNFAFEGVGQNETIDLTADVEFTGLTIWQRQWEQLGFSMTDLMKLLEPIVALEAYELPPSVGATVHFYPTQAH